MNLTKKSFLAITLLLMMIGTSVYAQMCVFTGNVSATRDTANSDTYWVDLENHNNYMVNVYVTVVYKGKEVSNETLCVLSPKESRDDLRISHWAGSETGFDSDYLSHKIIVTKCD